MPSTTEIYTLSLHDALPIYPIAIYKWNNALGFYAFRVSRHAIVGFLTVKDYRFQGVHRFFGGGARSNEQIFFDERLVVRKIYGEYPNLSRCSVSKRTVHQISLYNMADISFNLMKHRNENNARPEEQ